MIKEIKEVIGLILEVEKLLKEGKYGTGEEAEKKAVAAITQIIINNAK